MAGLHDIDHDNVAAYEQSVEADKLLAAGRVDEARRAMAKAAALSRTYAVRAELFGTKDSRKIQVAKTVRRTLVPFLTDAGFALQFAPPWSEGNPFQRVVGDVDQSVLIGREKFGHRLGIVAAWWRDPEKVEHFSWRPAGMLSNTLAYTTQRELDAVCDLWCKLMSEYLWPWFDQHNRTGQEEVP